MIVLSHSSSEQNKCKKKYILIHQNVNLKHTSSFKVATLHKEIYCIIHKFFSNVLFLRKFLILPNLITSSC